MPSQDRPKEQLLATDMNAVGWFHIPVLDWQRAKAFYEHVLDIELDMQQMDEHVLMMFPSGEDLKGAPGCLCQTPGTKPSNTGTMVFFNVTAIDEVLRRVGASGGKVIRDKTDIGGKGFCAIFEDTEGNYLGLHDMK